MAEDREPRHVEAAHMLGPHVVGRRVVVRRALPGETGPTGGPAYTDHLGVCRSWGAGRCEVEREDGTVVSVPIAEIVSGKPVPARPSVRLRVPARTLHLHSTAMFPGLDAHPLGDWLLRETPGDERKRANSALAVGDPGTSLAEASAAVRAFYGERGRPPLAQVVVDDETDAALTSMGWAPPATGDGLSLVLVASLARVLRAARHRPPAEVFPEDVVDEGGRLLVRSADGSRARAVVSPGSDLVGLHDLWVPPPARRRGRATALMLELLDQAASRGATTAYLQVLDGETAARRLYERLGFVAHHAYRYLGPPLCASPRVGP